MKDTNVDFVDYVEKFMVACDQTVDTENEEQANLYYRLIAKNPMKYILPALTVLE